MLITNLHERVLNASPEKVGMLIDGLASDEDRLWPRDRWPPMRFDRPLGVGAVGGHGPIGYSVESYQPGECIQFRFISPKGFFGVHRFEVQPIEENKTVLRHVIETKIFGFDRVVWVLAIRPLHDALMEDALDRANASLGGPVRRRSWSVWVKFLRWAIRRALKRKADHA